MCESYSDSVITALFFFQEAENRGATELKEQLDNGGEEVKEGNKTQIILILSYRRSEKHETRLTATRFNLFYLLFKYKQKWIINYFQKKKWIIN